MLNNRANQIKKQKTNDTTTVRATDERQRQKLNQGARNIWTYSVE